MRRAEGLFRRAILQSGAAQHVISTATARRVGQILAEKLGLAATREAIAAVPVERLLTAQVELRDDLAAHPDPERWGREVVISMMPWQPVIDGDLIDATPLDCIAAGASADIDVIVGTNTDENRLFLVPGGAIDQSPFEALAGVVAAYGLPVGATLAAYREAHPGVSAGDLLAAIQTDWCWRIPAIRLADARAKSPASTFMYDSRGALRSSMVASAPAMRLRSLSSLTRWATGLNCFGERVHHNSSPTPCTTLGLRLPAMETAVGPGTISTAGQQCALTRPRRS